MSSEQARQAEKQAVQKAKGCHGNLKPQQKRRNRSGSNAKTKKNNQVGKQLPKTEKVDTEIEDLAKKIRMDNAKKMIQLKSVPVALNVASVEKSLPVEVKSEDWSSVMGHFGWEEIANTTVPYLMRSEERYVSLRMADNRVLFRYKSLFTDELRSCFRLKILHATLAEAQLLNEINIRHCDNFYGRLEFSVSDSIISLKDFSEMYAFLNFCHLRFIEKVSAPQDRCGFIRIATQNCVPYVWYDKAKYVPLFYFEGECKYLEEHSIVLTGWELAYLKLSCKIQGIRKTLYDQDSLHVVQLELVKKFFPPDTLFEENWPDECKIDSLVQKPASKVVFSQAQVKVTQDKVQPNQDSQTEAMKKDAFTPRKEQLSMIPPKPQSVVATTTQGSLTLIQSRPSATTVTTSAANNLQVHPMVAPRVPVPRAVVSAVPVPRTVVSTVPVLRGGFSVVNGFQRTLAPIRAAPPAFAPNNVLNYRPPLMVTPLRPFRPYQKGSRLLQIPEVICNNAYFVVKAQVENKFFHCCINLEPFVTTILLVSLEESASFLRLPLELVVKAVNVMNIDIFLPNSMQRREYEKFGVYSTKGLLKLGEFRENLSQLRYILSKSVFD